MYGYARRLGAWTSAPKRSFRRSTINLDVHLRQPGDDLVAGLGIAVQVDRGEPGAVAKVKPIESELKETLARAKMAIRPEVRAAFVISEFGGHQDVAALEVQLKIGMNDVRKNGLRQCEAMLYCQAHALQAIFVNYGAAGTR